MRNMAVVFKKQIKDTVKNKTILIQFLMFPMMTLIMENTVRMEGMPDHFFVKLFSVMYIGMAPITSIAAILSEEKEKNTLRVLMMANVKPWEYLLGVGSYVWLICMLGAVVMGITAHFEGSRMLLYLAVMGTGFILSIIAGAAIGIFAKDQMKATGIVMPVMMVFSFLPMLSMFNDTIRKIARFAYTQQLNLILQDNFRIEQIHTNVAVVFLNLVLFVILFAAAYRKNGLE